jgi:nitrogen-specific signal transduction histidine kinase
MSFQSLIYQSKQSVVLTIRDISKIDEIAKLQAENKMVNMYTSSITHEMLTPLKCIIELANVLYAKLKDSRSLDLTKLILTTT